MTQKRTLTAVTTSDLAPNVNNAIASAGAQRDNYIEHYGLGILFRLEVGRGCHNGFFEFHISASSYFAALAARTRSLTARNV
jgi:hypothetical protein